ncbi:MAG TPA: hypothetical protein VLS25_05550 [Dehalococcoidia bacterium]|nr:hypothetical protein [Dehalococcoidia bacterium]
MELVGWIDVQHWRDVAVLAFTLAGTLLFILAIGVTGAVGWASYRTVNKARSILSNNVQPTLENVRVTSETVRGTVGFISDNAVKPVVRVYSTYAGARRFVSVLVKFTRPKDAG